MSTRVQKGISDLDHAASKGVIPINWRHLIKQRWNEVRFADLNYSIPAILLGTTHNAAINRMKSMTCFSASSGFLIDTSKRQLCNDTKILRSEWEKELDTNNRIRYISRECVMVVYDGAPFYITKSHSERKVHGSPFSMIAINYVYTIESKFAPPFPTEYKTLQSARRAIRKYTTKKEGVFIK